MSGLRALPAAAAAPAADVRAVWLLLAVLVVLFGASWPVARLALLTGEATPAWLAASRSGLACGTLVLLLGVTGRLRWPGRADVPALLAIGVLQLSAFFALCHFAVALVPAGRTAILSNAAIIWIVPFTALLGGRVPPLRWLAAGLGLAGVLALAGPWSIDWSQPEPVLGHALLLAAALVWAGTILVNRHRPPRLPAMELLPAAFALSTLLLVALALWREPGGGIGPAAIPHAMFNGMLVAPLGTWCLVELSRRLPTTVTAILLLVIPAAGVTFSALLLREPIGPDILAGGALIAAGVALAARDPGGKR